MEVFNSPSSLPKDPVLRKQQLDDLMGQISGSFSFMQVIVAYCESHSVRGNLIELLLFSKIIK